MADITVIIVIKDNPPTLTASLESACLIASKIMIGDIGMSDEAKAIVRKYKNAKIIKIDRPVLYVELIREELRQMADTESVFFLDPDEIIPESLAQVLLENLEHDVIEIPRKNIIFGKWIQHARWWPDYQLRLFKKDSLVWPKKLHAQPHILKASTFQLPAVEKNAMIHHNYENISHYLEKEIRYAKAEASERLTARANYNIGEMLNDSLSEFIGRFFAAEGYRDGMHGAALSFLQMIYPILVYLFYWEGKKYQEENMKDVAHSIRDFFQKALSETNYWLIKSQMVEGMRKVKLRLQSRFLK